jgi:hypothetical protein
MHEHSRGTAEQRMRVVFAGIGLGTMLVLALGLTFGSGHATEAPRAISSLLVASAPSAGTALLVMGANVDTDADGGFKADDHPLARATHVQPADAGVVPDAGQPKKRHHHP